MTATCGGEKTRASCCVVLLATRTRTRATDLVLVSHPGKITKSGHCTEDGSAAGMREADQR